MLELNDRQIIEISKLFMDLGKAMLFVTFTTQFGLYVNQIVLIKFILTSILCIVFSLKLLELRRKNV